MPKHSADWHRMAWLQKQGTYFPSVRLEQHGVFKHILYISVPLCVL